MKVFKEPQSQDGSFCRRGEPLFDWLLRSTNRDAQRCREFLNCHLSYFFDEMGRYFCHHLKHRWKSAFFELMVARLLQEMGAELEFEKANRDGHKPDFIANFSKQKVIIEATTPEIDKEVETLDKKRNPLLDIIEKETPSGLCVEVWKIPDMSSNDSKREFKRKIKKLFQNLPPKINEKGMNIKSGDIVLNVIPRKWNSESIILEPPITVFDNTKARIKHIMKKKRRQIRESEFPVILAVQASGISSKFHHYDMALFGHSFERHDSDYNITEKGFHSDGILNKNNNTDKEPAYAGVLAFLEVNFNKFSLPILYRHSRYKGEFPSELKQIENRIFEEESNEIKIISPNKRGLLKRLCAFTINNFRRKEKH